MAVFEPLKAGIGNFSLRAGLVFCLWVLLQGSAFSQDIPVLERKISITAKQERLDLFLKRLSEVGGCVFSYSPSAIDVTRTITGNFANQPLREVLELVFEGKVEIKLKGVYVILTPKSTSSKDLLVSGYVIDKKTGKAIRDATVYDPITLKSSTTNEYGFFELSVKNPALDSLELVVTKQDYSETLVIKDKNNAFNKILLQAKEVDFSEIGETIAKPVKNFWAWTKNSVGFTNLENVRDTLHRGFQASLVPFVGTNRKISGSVSNDYSLNLLGGFSGGTNRLELGGLFNLSSGNVQHVQAAGLFNQVSGNVRGAQFAGLANLTYSNVEGVQSAGLINFNLGQVRGAQLAGLINVAGKGINGGQASLLANYAGKNINGVQISPILNIGNNVRGVQLGLLNYADSIHGTPIGLISFVRKGYHQVEIGADEVLPLNLSLRTGTRSFYNMIFAGVRPENADTTVWAFGYGIGTSPRIGRKTFLNIEFSSSQLNNGNVLALNLINKAYVGIEHQFVKGFGFYLGPSINWRVYDNTFQDHPTLFTYTNPAILRENTFPEYNLASQLWVGARAGLRFF